MINSPFDARRSDHPAVVPVEKLRDHVAKLNNYRWIADSGKLYFVAKRTKADGAIEHFVDRHI